MRLGGVRLEYDEAKLGVDVFEARASDLARVLAGSTVALKARLLDQHRVAGIGNLLADEALLEGRRPRPDPAVGRASPRRRSAAFTVTCGPPWRSLTLRGRFAHRRHCSPPAGRAAPVRGTGRPMRPGHRRRTDDLVVPHHQH